MAAPVLEAPGVPVPGELIDQYGQVVDGLTTLASSDLAQLVGSMDPGRPGASRDVLLATVPGLLEPYIVAAGDAGATFYEVVRGIAAVGGRFLASTVAAPDESRYDALVRWAVGSWFHPDNETDVLTLLAGGAQRIVSGAFRDTIAGNAAVDDVLVGYQRVAAPGCCAFCAMLASRGELNANPDDAERVIGRGVPVEKTKGRSGGQGRGVLPRRTRQIGDEYHDYCRCRAVPVFESTYVELQEEAAQYYETYRDAADKIAEGQELRWVEFPEAKRGGREGRFEWFHANGARLTDKKRLEMTLASMRQALGAR